MHYRQISGRAVTKISYIRVALVLFVASANVSNAAPAAELFKSGDGSPPRQPSEVEQTAQISATIESPQCYENNGCPHKDSISEDQIKDFSCENLWLVRNTIFHQRGYCFQSARGRANFDNSRCSSNSIAALNLSEIETENVATIREVEQRKGCQ